MKQRAKITNWDKGIAHMKCGIAPYNYGYHSPGWLMTKIGHDIGAIVEKSKC